MRSPRLFGRLGGQLTTYFGCFSDRLLDRLHQDVAVHHFLASYAIDHPNRPRARLQARGPAGFSDQQRDSARKVGHRIVIGWSPTLRYPWHPLSRSRLSGARVHAATVDLACAGTPCRMICERVSACFAILPVAGSGTCRQSLVPVRFLRGMRSDMQDGRHRSESAWFQHRGRPCLRLSSIADRLRSRGAIRIHGILQCLAGLERRRSRRGYLHVFARSRIASRTGGPVPRAEGSESEDPDFLASGQGLGNGLEHGVYRGPGR